MTETEVPMYSLECTSEKSAKVSPRQILRFEFKNELHDARQLVLENIEHFDRTGEVLYMKGVCKTPTEYAVYWLFPSLVVKCLDKYKDVQNAYNFFMDFFLTCERPGEGHVDTCIALIRAGGDLVSYLESRLALSMDERGRVIAFHKSLAIKDD